MSAPIFRSATRADLPAIVAMLADDMLGATRESPAEMAPYAVAFDAISQDASIDLIVMEIYGKVIGTAQLAFIPGLSHRGMIRADIEAVRISKDLRGGGYGSALIEHCVARAAGRGAGMVQLSSNASRTDAHRFYRRLGFEQSHVGFKRTVSAADSTSGIHDEVTASYNSGNDRS